MLPADRVAQAAGLDGAGARLQAPLVEQAAPSPSSAVAALSHARVACPQHGLLHAEFTSSCGECGTKVYRLDVDDDRSVLASLRQVAKSRRMNVARFITYPIATLIVLGPSFGITWLSLLLIPVLGEPMARAVEVGLRRVQPARVRTLDRELLGERHH